MGAGDDVFVWNPGDGNDVIDGQAGHDEMLFNGANINEKIDLSNNGGHLRFTRDVSVANEVRIRGIDARPCHQSILHELFRIILGLERSDCRLWKALRRPFNARSPPSRTSST